MNEETQVVRDGITKTRTYDDTTIVVGGITARRYTDRWPDEEQSAEWGHEINHHEYGWEMWEADVTNNVVDLPGQMIRAITALEKADRDW